MTNSSNHLRPASGQSTVTRPSIRSLHFLLVFTFSVLWVLGMLATGFLFVLIIFQGFMIVLVPDPWRYAGIDPVREAWIETLKPIAFILFLIFLLLIVLGFLLQRYRISFASSLSLILPVFSNFTVWTMTWLAGLSSLVMLWLPLLENCPHALALGDILFAPLILPVLIPLSSYDSYDAFWHDFGSIYFIFGLLLPFLCMVIGLLIFILGVTTLLYGKIQGHSLVDFWIYQYSRHPQYFGFLLFLYGFTIFAGFRLGLTPYIPPPTLFWLISALSVIGMSLREETRILREWGEDYVIWRAQTPFMVPLPNIISQILMFPLKTILKKSSPENGKEIILVLLIYGLLIILFSLPFIFLFYPSSGFFSSVLDL